ncbi:hypothetical protein [Brevundimonas sp.]|uniref:hypothetical protein n=1 Tax=Brevundimonas sp. TaxID=1871086 RepID=UPI002C3C67EB|nr:hypothetical protein [Brevundimonas sp.]HWQ85125.1 hypothetical protein [Brevundimonas sp.]
MRAFTLAAPVLFLLVAGCAPTTGGARADDELQRLAADCTARDGILVATGRQTGRPRLDNACRIIGASRLPSAD